MRVIETFSTFSRMEIDAQNRVLWESILSRNWSIHRWCTFIAGLTVLQNSLPVIAYLASNWTSWPCQIRQWTEYGFKHLTTIFSSCWLKELQTAAEAPTPKLTWERKWAYLRSEWTFSVLSYKLQNIIILKLQVQATVYVQFCIVKFRREGNFFWIFLSNANITYFTENDKLCSKVQSLKCFKILTPSSPNWSNRGKM